MIILKKLNGYQPVNQNLKRTSQKNEGKFQGKGITIMNQELLSNFTFINMCQEPLLLQV